MWGACEPTTADTRVSNPQDNSVSQLQTCDTASWKKSALNRGFHPWARVVRPLRGGGPPQWSAITCTRTALRITGGLSIACN